MKRTVHEVSRLCGVSVRTLHYYDEIGLLRPSEITGAGYRLYDDRALERLQQILFFRELDFALKDIQKIMGNPSFDKNQALRQHRQLLVMRRDRLNGLIRLVENTLNGDETMSFKEFDTSKIEAIQKEYAKEAQERWGTTSAYAESQRRTARYGKKEWAEIEAEAEKIYNRFAANMEKEPCDPAVQQLVLEWQAHITKYYYDCKKEILAGLGEMYAADERFRQNIDRHKDGLAQFMSDAIKVYCKNS